MKTMNLRVNKSNSFEIQKMGFSYGFRWDSGSRIPRFPTHEQQFILVINFTDKTFSAYPDSIRENYFNVPGKPGITVDDLQKKIDDAHDEFEHISEKRKDYLQLLSKHLEKIERLETEIEDQKERIYFLQRLRKCFVLYRRKIDVVETPEFGSRRLPKLEPNPKHPPIYKKPYQRTKVEKPEMFFEDLEFVEE